MGASKAKYLFNFHHNKTDENLKTVGAHIESTDLIL
jgi:hypothetical protein